MEMLNFSGQLKNEISHFSAFVDSKSEDTFNRPPFRAKETWKNAFNRPPFRAKKIFVLFF